MDWARLHAALNDLPAALLLVAVLFELLGAVNRRESLRAAGFWTLLAGVAGALLAVGAGLMAEEAVEESARAHDLMEWHENFAFVVLGVFGVMLLWRLVRRAMGRTETVAYLAAGLVGVAMLIATSRVGGSLVFDHAVGIRTDALQSIQLERRQHADTDTEGHDAEHDSTHEASAPAR